MVSTSQTDVAKPSAAIEIVSQFKHVIFAVARALAIVALLAQVIVVASASSQDDLWSAVRGGTAVVIMRHALAPGTGDPVNFDVGDCTTQRNLSDEGRQQAVAIGDRFRANGIAEAEVLSSAWCRCLETAELLGFGPAENLPALDSFFRNRERSETQTMALKDWLASRPPDAGPAVLVTHQVNITALTGVFPRSGEMVVVRTTPGGEVRLLGRM